MEEETKIRINLVIDKEVNPELFEYIKKVQKMKRAAKVRTDLEKLLRNEK